MKLWHSGAFVPGELNSPELLMSSADGEAAIGKLTDKATYERLERDVAAVKNDIPPPPTRSPMRSIRSPAPPGSRRAAATRKPGPMSIRRWTVLRSAAAP